MGKLEQKDFDINNYEGFYEDHHFMEMTDEMALNAHRGIPRVAWAVDVAEEIQPESVLDLGCLEGFTLLTLCNKVPSIKRGVGVDLSADGIRLASGRKDKLKANLDFVQDSIEHYLENCKEKFDLICLFEVIEHVKDPLYLIELMDKVKSENGQIIISTPDFESPAYGKDDEQNKCHIRLYTIEDENYQAMNKYGNVRTATSLSKQVGKERLMEMKVYSHLINARYK